MWTAPIYTLSFAILGILYLTTSLQSTLFQNPDTVTGTGRTEEQMDNFVSNIIGLDILMSQVQAVERALGELQTKHRREGCHRSNPLVTIILLLLLSQIRDREMLNFLYWPVYNHILTNISPSLDGAAGCLHSKRILFTNPTFVPLDYCIIKFVTVQTTYIHHKKQT